MQCMRCLKEVNSCDYAIWERECKTCQAFGRLEDDNRRLMREKDRPCESSAGWGIEDSKSVAEIENAELLNELTTLRAKLTVAEARAEAAEKLALEFKNALRDTVKASGGLATESVSDSFLILGVPAEMAARRKLQESAEAALAEERARHEELATLVLEMHGKAFKGKNYVYTDSRTTCDLVIADLLATRVELAEERARLDWVLTYISWAQSIVFSLTDVEDETSRQYLDRKHAAIDAARKAGG